MTVTISGSGPIGGVTTLGNVTTLTMSSGTIAGLSAGGLPSASVTQSNLAAGVAGTGPAFRAYAATSTSVAAAVDTKITLDAETFDTNNNFSGSRFTPNVAGYYHISAQLTGTFSALTPNGYLNAYIFKNGSNYSIGISQPFNGNWAGSSVSTIVYLNGSTDYVELYAGTNNNGTFTNVNQSIATNMCGVLVRAA